MRKRKTPSERVFKAGYVIRRELITGPESGGEPFEMNSAYTPSGEYIGSPRVARMLCVKRGIRPQANSQSNNVCSIGFSTKDGKWYGWSHRAIFGFRKGSMCEKGDCHYVPRRRGGRGKWIAKNIADAKQMACDFAESVS